MRTTRLLTTLALACLTAPGLALVAPAAEAADTDIRINEIESDGGAVADFIELRNVGTAAVDISGWVVKDSDDNRTLAVPQGTSVAPGAYHTIDTDVAGGFGLGSSDSARIFLPGGTRLIDSYSWTQHATTTYGRCPDGTGLFTTTAASTRNAANSCTTPANQNAVVWPGGSSVTTVDPPGLTTENLSGLYYQPSGSAAPGTIYAVKNGNASTLFKLQKSGSTWGPAPGDWATGKNLDYPGGAGEPDAEGVTLTDAGPAGGVFVATERNNDASTVSRPAIVRFDDVEAAGTSLRATRDYDLSTDLPGLGSNLGPEAIAWVPDSALVAGGFADQTTGAAYDPATYPGHGTGLFFVGIEQNGQVIAYALDQSSDDFTRVAASNSGLPAVMDLTWDPATSSIWAACDNTCQGRITRLGVDSTAGSPTRGGLANLATYERPAGMGDLNNEGFALAPATECDPATGTKPVFWADDGDTATFSLREGTVGCGNPPAPAPTPGVPDPAPTPAPAPAPVVAPVADTTAPTRVKVKGVKNGGVYLAQRPTLRCAAVDAHLVSCRITRKTQRFAGAFVVVRAKARAVDAAGNTTVSKKTYVVRR